MSKSVFIITCLAFGLLAYFATSWLLLNTATILRIDLATDQEGIFKIYLWDDVNQQHSEKLSIISKSNLSGEQSNVQQKIPPGKIENIRIDIDQTIPRLKIHTISFQNIYFPVVTLKPAEIISNFIRNDIKFSHLGDYVVCEITGPDPYLILTQKPILRNKAYVAGIFMFLTLGMVFLGLTIKSEIRIFVWRNLDALIAIVGLACGVAIFYPGGMSNDTIGQWSQVLHPGKITNWHPAIMVHLWWAMNLVIPGPQGMLILHYALYFSAIFMFGRMFFSQPLPRVIYLIFVGFFPVTFLMVGVIWKDISLLVAVAISYVLLFCFKKFRSVMMLILSIIFLFYAVSVRHNAIFCTIPYAIYLVDIFMKGQNKSELLKKCMLVILIAGAFVFFDKLYTNVSVSRINYQIENSIFIWDLWGISVEKGENLLPHYVFKPEYADISQDDLEKYYKPYTNSVVFSDIVSEKLWSPAFPDKEFKNHFGEVLVHDLLTYLKVRLRVVGYMLNPKTIFGHYAFGIQKFSSDHYLYKYSNNIESQHPSILYWARSLANWLLENTFLFNIWIYLFGCIMQLGFMWVNRKYYIFAKESLALLSAGLIYWLPYIFISTSNDMRYSIFSVFCCIAIFPVSSIVFFKIIKERYSIRVEEIANR